MARLKGVAPAMVIGFMIMVLVTVIFVFDKKIELDDRIEIYSSSRDAYKLVHTSELIKKSIDSSIGFDVVSAAGDIGKIGGGYSKWSIDSPTISQLEDSYIALIESKMDEMVFLERDEYKVDFSDTEIEEIDHDSDNIVITGSKGYSIETVRNNPSVLIEARGRFNRTADTSYFHVLRAGRSLFDGDEGIGTDLLNQSLLNGFGDQKGISPYDDNAQSRAEGVANKLEDHLGSKYGLEFEIEPAIAEQEEGNTTQVFVTTRISITDPGSYVPGEESETSLILRFTSVFSYIFEEDTTG